MEADEDDTTRYMGNAFQAHMARYKILTDMVKSNGNNTKLANFLDEGIERMSMENAVENKRATATKGSTVGLLELDSRPWDKRRKPAQSPERKGKRK
jgi:hypothetical protein